MTCGCHSHNGFVLSSSSCLDELAQRESFRPVGVDMEPSQLYLDLPVSVSAPELLWSCDEMLDQQYRRFLNGS